MFAVRLGTAASLIYFVVLPSGPIEGLSICVEAVKYKSKFRQFAIPNRIWGTRMALLKGLPKFNESISGKTSSATKGCQNCPINKKNGSVEFSGGLTYLCK